MALQPYNPQPLSQNLPPAVQGVTGAGPPPAFLAGHLLTEDEADEEYAYHRAFKARRLVDPTFSDAAEEATMDVRMQIVFAAAAAALGLLPQGPAGMQQLLQALLQGQQQQAQTLQAMQQGQQQQAQTQQQQAQTLQAMQQGQQQQAQTQQQQAQTLQAMQQDVAVLRARGDNERIRRRNKASIASENPNAPLEPLQIETPLPGLAPPGQVPQFAFPFPATVGALVNINQHQHANAIAQAYGLQLQEALLGNRVMEIKLFLSMEP